MNVIGHYHIAVDMYFRRERRRDFYLFSYDQSYGGKHDKGILR